MIAGVLLHQALRDRQKLWGLRWQLLLLALGFLIGLGPLLAFSIKHPNDFNARLVQVSIFQSGWFDQQRAAPSAHEPAWRSGAPFMTRRCHCSTVVRRSSF